MRFLLVFLVLLVLPLSATAQDKPRIRGLLIGISEYRSSRYWGPLHGIEDAELMRETLQNRFGAQASDLVLLGGVEATAKNIRAQLEVLEEKAQKGEILVFFFSGHGSVVPDQVDGDETDGVDECLVPYDAPSHRSKKFPNSVIRDDEFQEFISRLHEKVGPQGHILLVFDSCHSGTMNRAAIEAGFQSKTKAVVDLPVSRDASIQEQLPKGVAVLTACKAFEIAADNVKDKQGVFTQALAEALKDPRLEANSSYLDLMNRVKMYGEFLGQNPQFEGPWSAKILGGRAKKKSRIGRLLDTEGWVSNGTLAGLYPGSIVRAEGLEGKVLESKLSRARIAFPESVPKELVGAEVTLVKQSTGPKALSIHCPNREFRLPEFARKAKEAKGADLILEKTDATSWSAWDQQGHAFPIPSSDLSSTLRRLNQRRYLMNLVYKPHKIRVSLTSGQFSSPSQNLGFQEGPQTHESDGILLVEPRQHVRLQIENLTATPLHLEVLNFESDGHVKLLPISYPYLEPGAKKDFALGFSPNTLFPEGLKVVASRENLDLSGARTRSESNPLSQFLNSGLRGSEAPTILNEPNSYFISDTVFVRCR